MTNSRPSRTITAEQARGQNSINLEKLESARRKLKKSLYWLQGVIAVGLGMAIAALGIENFGEDSWLYRIGILVAFFATIAVGGAMLKETLETRGISLTLRDEAILAAHRSKAAKYKELPPSVIRWNLGFSAVFWLSAVFVILMAVASLTSVKYLGILFLSLLMMFPAYLARQYSRDLLRIYGANSHPIDSLNYIKGTTSAREVVSYWVAFGGLFAINALPGTVADVPSQYLTPVLVLLSVGSTAKMVASGKKEFYEAREILTGAPDVATTSHQTKR